MVVMCDVISRVFFIKKKTRALRFMMNKHVGVI